MRVLIANGGSNGAQSMVASAIARQLRDAGDNVTLHCPRVASGRRTRPVTYGEEEGDIEPSAHLLGVEEVLRTCTHLRIHALNAYNASEHACKNKTIHTYHTCRYSLCRTRENGVVQRFGSMSQQDLHTIF